MLRTLCEHCAHLTYWLEQIWATSGNLTVDLATADFIVPSQFDPGSAPPNRRATAALVVGVGKHWRPQSPRRCALAQPVRVPVRRSTDRRFAWPNV
jgi:hypothetical protein